MEASLVRDPPSSTPQQNPALAEALTGTCLADG